MCWSVTNFLIINLLNWQELGMCCSIFVEGRTLALVTAPTATNLNTQRNDNQGFWLIFFQEQYIGVPMVFSPVIFMDVQCSYCFPAVEILRL